MGAEYQHCVIKRHTAQHMTVSRSLPPSLSVSFSFSDQYFPNNLNLCISTIQNTESQVRMEDCTRGAGCAVLMRHPYTRGGSPHFILISNEHCISHKLFAKCGYACLSLTEASDLTSLPSGDRRGGSPRCPPSYPQHLQQSGRRVQQACQIVTGLVGPLGFCFRSDYRIRQEVFTSSRIWIF